MQSNQEKIRQVENGLRQEYFIKGARLKSITEVMEEISIPGVSVAVVHNFEIIWAKEYGISDTETQQPVNTNTIFQAASISKPLTALAVMKLVQDGKLDLDENINSYLKTWKLPENELTVKNKVTLRNLLSHTAGITVHGFPGYNIDAEMPTLVQVLNGEFPSNTGKVVVDMEPNTEFRYSGGGYTIVQQALIDQLQKSFQGIMQELVLDPLDMKNSFYSNSTLKEEQCTNTTAGHKGNGIQILGKRHVYPEMAAAGLWTTAEDLAKFFIEVQKSLKGKSNKIISKELMEIMTTPVLNGEYNIGLRNEKIGTEQLLGHSGGNEGYTCSMIFQKEKGVGAIFMSNCDNGYEMKMPFFRSVAAAYGWNNILIDTNRTVKIEFREDSGKLYMNENIIERLNDGEKLGSDYIEEGNLEQAVRWYQELVKKDNDMYNWLENNLNNAGYNCLWRKFYNTAIAFLKINTILFSKSANAWDSLGETYFHNKQYELCIEAMKKSLEYRQNNQNGVKFIKDAEEYLKKQI